MSGGSIYLVAGNGALTRMSPGAPATEDRIQELVARYPELIADRDGALLLIRREQPIGDSAEWTSRWALDHLFVTRGAVPVLVEIKRASDTRLRREVVGQMLDYAANGVSYWQAGRIAESFATTCTAAGAEPEIVLRDFLGDADPAVFWSQVDANFQAGRVKLVFVADAIPRELASIVEFLNDQMRADVRAIELKWYEGEGSTTTLVPRVIGESQRIAGQKANARELIPIGRAEWIAQNIAPMGNDALKGTEYFISLMESLGGYCDVPSTQGSIYAKFLGDDGRPVYPMHLWKDSGLASISFKWICARPGLVDEDVRKQVYEAFVAVVGPLTTTNLKGFPGFRVALLADSGLAERLVPVVTRLVELAKRKES